MGDLQGFYDRKFDHGKSRMDLLPLSALEAIGDVLAYGALKYAADSWRTVPQAHERYSAALLRHLAAASRGELLDSESGLSHLAHMACNALFLVQLQLDSFMPPAGGKSDAK